MDNAEGGDRSKPKLITGPPARGARVRPLYVERRMKVYALHEHEIRTLSLMNTLSAIFFSASSGLASFGLGILVNALFQETLTPTGEVLYRLGVPTLIALALISAGAGIWAARARSSTFEQIRSESKGRADD